MMDTWTPTTEADIKRFGCETCRFFCERGVNDLSNPEVSKAAFRAVFHDVPEIQTMDLDVK